MDFKKEQIYIVTGASSGIGEATALLLNEKGATVVAIARNEERLNKMKDKCKYPENMYIELKDLAEDIEGLPKYVKDLKEKYGKFSGMAYCVGVSAVNPIKAVSFEYAQQIFNINYFAPLLMTRGITDKRNNVGEGTSLVFVSSIDALLNSRGQCVYAGSKAALSASMKTISKEVSDNGVRINCVLPSMIKTPMAYDSVKKYSVNKNYDQDRDLYPFGWGEPIDVANMIVYLMSDNVKYISGQNYVIDSGGIL